MKEKNPQHDKYHLSYIYVYFYTIAIFKCRPTWETRTSNWDVGKHSGWKHNTKVTLTKHVNYIANRKLKWLYLNSEQWRNIHFYYLLTHGRPITTIHEANRESWMINTISYPLVVTQQIRFPIPNLHSVSIENRISFSTAVYEHYSFIACLFKSLQATSSMCSQLIDTIFTTRRDAAFI